VSGDELATRALQQAKRLGAEILVTRSVTHLDLATRQVFLDGADVVRARTIILATGVTWRRVAIDGIDRLIGKGVYYGASRSEASVAHGRDIHLIGAGNSAGQAALHFANHARTVTLVVRGDALEKSMSRYLIEQLRTKSNVTIASRSEVRGLHGDVNLTAIDICDLTNESVRRVECGGLFVFIGADAETDWLPREIARDARGYVLTGDDVVKAGRWSRARDPYLLETSVAGVFACGDVRLSPVKRVASAVGEGSMAIALVQQYLQRAGESGERGLRDP
jgi:thioredoxin reductase (NADPH)